jgi:hypothetical protein
MTLKSVPVHGQPVGGVYGGSGGGKSTKATGYFPESESLKIQR